MLIPVAVLAVALPLLAACSSNGDASSKSTATPAPTNSAPGYAYDSPASCAGIARADGELPHLPASAQVSSLVLCGERYDTSGRAASRTGGQTIDRTTVTTTVTGTDLDTLVTLLARPDEPKSSDPCPAIYMLRPRMVAQIDGKAVEIRFPVDSCSQPNPEAVRFANKLLDRADS